MTTEKTPGLPLNGTKSVLLAVAAAFAAFAASAETHTIPAGTTETMDASNVETYNAYDTVVVSAGASLQFGGQETISYSKPLEIKPGGTNIVDSGVDVAIDNQYIAVGGYMRITNAMFRVAVPENVTDSAERKVFIVGRGGNTATYGFARMDIEDGAVVSNSFRVGYNYQDGVVVQRGGNVVLTSASGDTSAHKNHGGVMRGIYKLTGGSLEVTNTMLIGNSSYGAAVFAMYGGTLTHTYPSGVTDAYFDMSVASRPSLYYQAGGTANVRGFLLNRWHGACVLALTGESTVLESSQISAGYDKDLYAPAILTVTEGATLRVGNMGIRYEPVDYKGKIVYVVNFNGGTLRARNNSGYHDGTNKDKLGVMRYVIHDGGFVYDMDTYTDNSFYTPLRRATGNGVKSISWDKTTTFTAVPMVLIEETGGGSGWGASAVAEWDPDSRTVTDIKIVSPGCDYTEATAYFVYATSDKIALATTVGPNAGTGSFTKRGTGTGSGVLKLCTTNTWGGATILEHGELRCQSDFAVPENTALKLKGGKLNLRQSKATFRSIGGTAGSIQNSPTNAYEVASLDNDTASTLDLSAFSLSVTGRWDVAAADLIEGKHPAYTAAVSFGETATLSVDDLDALEDAGISKVTILETSSAFTGVPTLVGPTGDWSLTVKDKSLRLCRPRGTMIYFK